MPPGAIRPRRHNRRVAAASTMTAIASTAITTISGATPDPPLEPVGEVPAEPVPAGLASAAVGGEVGLGLRLGLAVGPGVGVGGAVGDGVGVGMLNDVVALALVPTAFLATTLGT
jgi:hypothetical protein